MPSCVRPLARTRPSIEQHIKELPGVQSECVTMDISMARTRPSIEQHIKELPGVQSECVTMDISMPMTLSVDSPTLPRLQYLSE